MNRLIWRCRLGSRELELILFRFLEHGYHSVSGSERRTFEKLLEHNHCDLNDWLVFGIQTYRDEYSDLIGKIRNCQLSENRSGLV
ncbi:MAG: succinate dehydrogenase assembly factor 2 [Acidiferrobacterales bacterium]|nr:succinate dehydrogenase assembly factor 2 [Acidiferrobacterales bacterium]